MSNAIAVASFDSLGSRYDASRVMPDNVLADLCRVLRDRVERSAAPRRALDAGCGTGQLLRHLPSPGWVVVGIDEVPRPLLRATARAAPARAVRGDAVRLPFRDGTFGLVVVAHVLEHVARWREMIHDCRRVLRVGGTLALVSSPGFQRNAPRSALKRALAARGWVNQRPGPSGRTEIEAGLNELGIEYELVEEAAWRWTRRQRIGTSLEFIARDEYSAFWSAPPDLLADAKREVIAEFAGSADDVETVAASLTCLVVGGGAAS